MRIHELGHIVLYVSNLTRSADFYKKTLGFHEIKRDLHMALFSSGRTHHEMLLIEVGGTPRSSLAPTPGLYHIGFKVGNSPEDLQEVYKELSGKGVHILGASDHTVTHSLYILDPDNNELELYADVDDVWKSHPEAVLSPVKRLDL
jgi:catechol-2,3-dioxygenase